LGEGEFTALAKRYKSTKQLREMSQFDAVFTDQSDFFLWKSGVFYPVSKINQVIGILELNSKEAKKQLRSAGLNFKQNPEKSLQFLVTKTSKN
jgi:hypothetical protein